MTELKSVQRQYDELHSKLIFILNVIGISNLKKKGEANLMEQFEKLVTIKKVLEDLKEKNNVKD